MSETWRIYKLLLSTSASNTDTNCSTAFIDKYMVNIYKKYTNKNYILLYKSVDFVRNIMLKSVKILLTLGIKFHKQINVFFSYNKY